MVDHQLTASDGTATVLAPDEGMVTIGYDTERVLPDGNGGSTTHVSGRLFTLSPIGDRSTLSHRIAGSRYRVENAPMTIALTTAVPSASSLSVQPTCATPDGTSATTVGVSNIDVRGCAGEPTFELTVVAIAAGGMPLGRKVFSALAHQPGQTLAISVSEAELEALPVDHEFTGSGGSIFAAAGGLDAQGNQRSWSTGFSPGPSSYSFPAPPADGVASWLVGESVYDGSVFSGRLRHLSAIPVSSSWDPPALLSRPIGSP